MFGKECVLVEGKKTGKAGLLWELRQLQINQRLSFVSLAMDKGVSICLGAPVNCHGDTDTRALPPPSTAFSSSCKAVLGEMKVCTLTTSVTNTECTCVRPQSVST